MSWRNGSIRSRVDLSFAFLGRKLDFLVTDPGDFLFRRRNIGSFGQTSVFDYERGV